MSKKMWPKATSISVNPLRNICKQQIEVVCIRGGSVRSYMYGAKNPYKYFSYLHSACHTQPSNYIGIRLNLKKTRK